MNQAIQNPHQNPQNNENIAGPKYVQIRRLLIQQMQAGTYKASQPLPSEPALADSLGVAVGTLRRALSGLESEGFIRRIHGKGTFVNSSQEQQNQLRTNLFSVILPAVNDAPYPAMIEGLHDAAAEIDHQIMVGHSDNDLVKQEKLIRQAVERNVAGVVIVPSTHATPPEQIRLLKASRIPFVFCNRPIQGVAAPLVTWSFEDVGRLSAEALMKHGHRRIICLTSVRYEFTQKVAQGARSAFEAHGIDSSNYQVHYHGEMRMGGDSVRRAIHESLVQISHYKEPATAIHCHSLEEAELVYLMAGEFGMRIPENLSLITFGDTHPKSVLAQRITCVTIDEREIGSRAGNMLREMCSPEPSEQSNRTIEVPLTFLTGETIGPAPTNHE